LVFPLNYYHSAEKKCEKCDTLSKLSGVVRDAWVFLENLMFAEHYAKDFGSKKLLPSS
jgi:hypothetical protein